MESLLLQKLKWLPNALTLSRAFLASAALLFALRDGWIVGFWLLLASLATDFLDGLAARTLHAMSKFGEGFDAVTDTLMVILGLISLSATGHLPWWETVLALAIGAALGSDRVVTQPVWKWRAVGAVASLFVAWVGIVWFYAHLAFGWSWLYIPFTCIVLAMCGLLKRHRIKTWLHC